MWKITPLGMRDGKSVHMGSNKRVESTPLCLIRIDGARTAEPSGLNTSANDDDDSRHQTRKAMGGRQRRLTGWR
uniref:Uncharacterized protein n=1 Tax=Panagrellus redivivus TaxID=6233 RepID=A0A7E4WCT9_PANRE